ncbi:bifunctional enoyl-CoA hydratase/phosphate acetyltransferase [Xanthobacter variabilis]|uniref:bifunctional enoyl-CoA hydratase/phosphate acetyltransferase n=1 Tax=Xanthobacter variabilis TaxID=3119932 RepID=UPI00372826FD
MPTVANRLFEEIKPGDSATTERTVRGSDLRAWASAFGDAGVVAGIGEGQAVAGISASLFAALVGSALPGPGGVIRNSAVTVCGALPVDAPLTVSLEVKETHAADRTLLLEGRLAGPHGGLIATATITVAAPTHAVKVEVPEHRLEGLLERCRGLNPMPTGVVHPLSLDAIAGALDAAVAGLILPVLFGPEADIRRIAEAGKLDLSGARIISTSGEEESAAKAAAAAGAGEVAALMKGSLHTDVLLHAVVQKEAGLRTGRLLSHCALMAVPTYARRVVVTDVALNIAPDTDQKRDICQNAIGFARALGVEKPKVAVLAAVEMVRTRMAATLDGAILAKMADRGQIVGGIVDGPLDLDAAVDPEAARVKHIVSPVAGAADVLLVPNIEAGNMVYKNLAFMSDAQTAGLVVGARVPVMLTSRADSAAARRFSAAAAVLYADALRREPEAILPVTAD